MRLLITTQNYYPAFSFGGRAVKSTALAQGLAQRGHDVAVLTSTVLERGVRPRLKGHSTRIDGVNVHYLGTWAQYRDISLNPEGFFFARREVSDFDAVHIIGLYDLIGPVIAWYARRYGVPYVVEPSGMLIPIVRNFALKRIYYALLGRLMLAGATQVIATSDQEESEMVCSGIKPDRIFNRRNGVDLSEFEQPGEPGGFRRYIGLEHDTRLLLYLGRLSPIKSIDLLIQTFASLPCSKAHLAIVGPDEGDGYRRYLEELVDRLKIRGRVLFTGPLYGADKVVALRDADLFVLPSQYESWGNTVVEAIAAGTPVVITDRCGVAPYVRDRVGLVVPHEEVALRHAIALLLSDRPLYHQFKRNCWTVAQELSWDEPIAQMESLYAELVKGERSSDGR